jgi:hypothetical protein
MRRATTDCQVGCQRCRQVGRLGRGRAVACGDRYGGCCWAGPAVVGGRSWPGRPVRMAWTLEKDNPQEPRPGGRRANPPAPGRLGPWGSSVPRGTPTAFPSLARECSRPTTRRPREPHRRNSGWRHPPPSGSPSGPVGPSGRNSNPDFPVQPRRPLGAKRNLEGGRGRVKAMFPLARRVCPAQDGRITSMGFPVMSRASGQARPGAHRFAAPPQEPWRACLRPGPGCAAPSSQPPTPARCCSTGTYSNARPRTGLPGRRAVSAQLEPHAGPILR